MKKILFFLLAVCSLQIAHAQYENTKIQVGQKAPDLQFQTPEGNTITLSDINDKRVVLLDFWASWCGPCRMANPALVEMYKKYSTKKFKGAKNGFTVVSVSLDQKKEAWIEAIKKDNLIWPYHMSDLKGWSSAAGAEYGIGFIPQCFLIDANGTIIGKYNHADECIQDLQKLVK